MLRFKIKWELETGEKYEEWTIPLELALAEKDLFNGKSVLRVLREDESPSTTFLLFLAHKIQTRVTKKPIAYDVFTKQVVDVQMAEFGEPNFTKQEA